MEARRARKRYQRAAERLFWRFVSFERGVEQAPEREGVGPSFRR